MLKLYENIRELRKLNSWTQEELATRMGYTDRSMIAKIESGKVDISQSKILEFAKIFGVEPGYLMGWEDESGQTTPHGKLVDSYVVSQKKDELYSIYMELSPEKQATFEAYLKFLQSQP